MLEHCVFQVVSFIMQSDSFKETDLMMLMLLSFCIFRFLPGI